MFVLGVDPGLTRCGYGAVRRDGSKLFTLATGVSLLVFFVLACQCMSTVAVVRREAGGWKWALFLVGYMTVLAYVGSFLAYRITLAATS